MKMATIALDIGATKIIIGRIRYDRVTALKHYETASLVRRPNDWSRLLVEIQKFWKPNVSAVAVGFAGPVENGIITAAPNFLAGIAPNQFSLQQFLSKRLGVPVAVFNDADCFTFGEAVLGAGRGRRCVVGLTLGTGVGGGIVIDGALYHGAHELSGEFGHLPFPSSQMRCGCGQQDHLETVLSGSGLSRLYALATGRAETSEDVVRAARRGDASAHQALWQIKEALVHLFLTVLITWDPDIIVVGGGLSRIPKLLITARSSARERVPFPALKRVPIVPSLLHDHAILLVAARLAARSNY